MKTISITNPQEIEATILRCKHCMVGLVDGDGNPYVIPMNFAYEDGNIYLHSGTTGSKLDMARKHPRTCVTFCEDGELVYMHREMACSYSMKARSVICQGDIEFVEDLAEKRRILVRLMHHYTDYPCHFSEPAVRNVQIWVVRVDRISCRQFGLKPSEIKPEG